MQFDRRVFATGATLLVAAAAGHLVQNADRYFGAGSVRAAAVQPVAAPAERVVTGVTPLAAVAEPVVPVAAAAAETDLIALPRAPAAAPALGTDTKALAARMAGLEQGFARPGAGKGTLNQFGLACDTRLTAEAAPAAMVRLTLEAPCNSDAGVVVTQGRLRFASRLSNTGALTVQVPALAETAVLVVQIEGGEMLTATAAIPDFAEYDRVALQWRGDNGMRIHAFEFGAGYRDDGHVWAGAPRSPAAGASARGGFLTVLGSPDLAEAQMAEVYSFPRGEDRHSGVVRVSVEAEVTKANCGREIAAETLQPGADGTMQAVEITLAVPDCSAVGEFLVLKNVLRDLKIASN